MHSNILETIKAQQEYIRTAELTPAQMRDAVEELALLQAELADAN